jgi:type II secretory pathway predicted ATPase ExeA
VNAKKLLSLYGLKWNPFTPDVPTEALLATKQIESFAWRVETLIQEGGFALITGDPGCGKSVALRILSERLKAMRDVSVGVIERPQSKVGDFYRELGEIFHVKLSPSNRYGGFKLLRERWKSHVESHRFRPVLLVDEAQEAPVEVLSEMRLLSSAHFDSVLYLTIILVGDGRLPELFRHEDLLPLGTRIRTRLVLEYASKDELRELLLHAMAKAGNARLMTEELADTLVDHAGGNQRSLMNMAAELLAHGMAKDGASLDEKLYLELFELEPSRTRAKARPKEGRS